ncbi:MAG: MBL fold metallo-hydrolase [Candidatus Coatesbacteria bacterium]|nr:MAG: MBL fold metallo-hydrolase [Candidatus Coatesbacteria bacterium]
MEIETVTVGPLTTNCYLAVAAGRVVIVDPGAQARKVIAAVADRPVEAVFLTHGHSDHAGAVDEVVSATGAPWFVSAADEALAANYVRTPPHRLFQDGDQIRFGTITWEVLATPGHTPGSVCFRGPGVLFSGDTLFAGGVGRTDLPGGSTEELFASLRDRILKLPDDTAVYPGHGPATTVGRERETNPYVEAGWV